MRGPRLRGLGFWGSRRVTGPSGQGTAGGDVRGVRARGRSFKRILRLVPYSPYENKDPQWPQRSERYPGKNSPARRTANPRHHTNKPSTRAPPRSEPGPNQPVECRRPASGRSGGDPTDAQPRGPTARSVGCESRLGAHLRAGRRGSQPAPPHGPPRPHCYHSLSNVRRQMIHLPPAVTAIQRNKGEGWRTLRHCISPPMSSPSPEKDLAA